jgi:transposase
VRLLLTVGQVSEHAQTEALIDGFLAGFVLAGKGYGSDAFVETIKASVTTPMIPPRSSRITPRDYGKDICKESSFVERLFQKLKSYRRVATRYERSALNYTAMLSLASILIGLK